MTVKEQKKTGLGIYQDRSTQIKYRYVFSAYNQSLMIMKEFHNVEFKGDRVWAKIGETTCDNELSARVKFFEFMDSIIMDARYVLELVQERG